MTLRDDGFGVSNEANEGTWAVTGEWNSVVWAPYPRNAGEEAFGRLHFPRLAPSGAALIRLSVLETYSGHFERR